MRHRRSVPALFIELEICLCGSVNNIGTSTLVLLML